LIDPVDKERLKALEDKINAVKASQQVEPKKEDHFSASQTGWRMVTELVAGIFIGFGIGYGLDVLFGTMPVFLMLFVLLGFAAGVRSMMRSAKELQMNQAAEAAKDERE
jgi:ATP synthase protein I